MKQALSGFGRLPTPDCDVRTWSPEVWSHWASRGGIARGLGRAYGDSACLRQLTVETHDLARIEQFDVMRGVLVAEGGISLFALLREIVPQGWFVHVTPGTQFVTLAGMIAADVHGKNHHHVGSFAHCVDWIEILGASGEPERISRDHDAEWFQWTCGGMGLTGLILRAQIRLLRISSPQITQSAVVTSDLQSTMQCFESHADAPYSVAWVDASARGAALGRSVVFVGAHQEATDVPPQDWIVHRERPYAVPQIPVSLVNRWSTDLFNALYYRKQRDGYSTVHWRHYFYPLDGLRNWNRVYGPRGFAQFQTVLPIDSAFTCIEVLLETVRACGFASPVTVLKKMGAEAPGLSFPMPGYTLTLDLPNRPGLDELMARLIDCAIDHGGRFYLAKDAHLTQAQFDRADPRATSFREFREVRGLSTVFVSEQSKRLGI